MFIEIPLTVPQAPAERHVVIPDLRTKLSVKLPLDLRLCPQHVKALRMARREQVGEAVTSATNGKGRTKARPTRQRQRDIHRNEDFEIHGRLVREVEFKNPIGKTDGVDQQ